MVYRAILQLLPLPINKGNNCAFVIFRGMNFEENCT